MKYFVGCTGWKNQHWTKTFYPSNLDPKYYLSYYSKFFNFVHLDLNYISNSPNHNVLRKWSEETPSDFRFTLKIPQFIINKQYANYNGDLGKFLENLTPLEEKILAILISPPSAINLKDDGRKWLEYTLNSCTYHGFDVVFDFNHSYWYQELTYSLLKKYKSSFVWSNSGYPYYYPAVTSNFIFIHLDGSQKGFDESKWIKLIQTKEREIVSLKDDNERSNTAVIVLNDPSNLDSFVTSLKIKEKGLKSFRPLQQQNLPIWTGKAIMHVDMDAFFPACEEIRDPTLKGKPHAVIMTPEKGDNITRGAVASCSYEARKYGIRSAMSLAKSKELCPNLILKPVDKPYYAQISQQVMRLLEEYADVIEQASIDEAYLDCTNKISQYQNQQLSKKHDYSNFKNEIEKDNISSSNKDHIQNEIEEYALIIKNSIKEQCYGLVCSVGVAPNKSVAKIASNFKKPDGLTIIYPQNISQFLSPLNVDRISGIGVKTNQVLKEIGIETIGQLSKYNVQKLMDKFGKKIGLWMWLVANGKENEPVSPREDNVSLSTEETLLEPTIDKKILEILLNEMADDIYERIRRKGYEFKTVGIKLVRIDFTIETRETSFSTYQNTKASIVSVLRPLLDRFQIGNYKDNLLDDIEKNSIRKLGIRISNLSKINRKNLVNQKTLLDYF